MKLNFITVFTALIIFPMLSMQAAEYTYSGLTGSNDWSSGTDWDFTPVSASDTTLTFTGILGDGATLTSNNDVADPFILNRLNLSYDGPASGTTPVVTFTGQDWNFVADGGTDPRIQFTTTTSIEPEYIINNNITLSDDLLINHALPSNGVLLSTFNGQISGTGKITISGGARQNSTTTLTNTANDWSGDIQVNISSTVSHNRRLQLGASEVIPNGVGKGNVILNSNGEASHAAIFELNGFNETINGLEAEYLANSRNRDYNQRVHNNAATDATLTLGDADTTANFMGRIQDGSTGSLGITKIGSGTQTFAGLARHTGDTTVNEGTVEVDFTQFGSSQTTDAADYFSTTSDVILNGSTFAIKGRESGGAVTDTVGTQQYANYISVSSSTIADQLVVGQELTVTRPDTSVDTYYVTGIIGTQIYTETRTSGGTATLTTSAISATTTQDLQSLTLGGLSGTESTIDFGNSDNVTLNINAAPIQINDGSILKISNWDGLLAGGGADRLIFSGNISEFSSVFDQSEVEFDGYGSGYNLIDGGGSYEVTAIPEPASLVLLLVSGLTFIAATRRRR